MHLSCSMAPSMETASAPISTKSSYRSGAGKSSLPATWAATKPGGPKGYRTAGACLVLPPKNLLDLNPIESAFVKIEYPFRKAAARRREAVSKTVPKLIQPYT
jgi:hypothetical protein